MSILDLSRRQRRSRYKHERAFVANLAADDMVRVICNPRDLDEVCCVSREGVTRADAARMILDEVAMRGVNFGSEK